MGAEGEVPVVTVRRRWPHPYTGEVIDQSENLGPGSVHKSRPGSSVPAANVGHMDAPAKANLSGWSKWSDNNLVSDPDNSIVIPLTKKGLANGKDT